MKKYNTILLCLFCLCYCSLPAEEISEYEYLDKIAVNSLTDKSSLFHNYTKIYAKYLGNLKNKPIKFLEIGIFKGNSVKMWEQYLTKADLHFIDITSQHIEYFSERATYHYLDQANSAQLSQFIIDTGGNFDIICDDGGHRMDQQFNSFVALFPTLKSGGLYIIEDLCTSYWACYGGNGDFENPKAGPGTMVGTLQALIDYINMPSAMTACADIDKMPPQLRANLNYFQENIVSMHFYDSVCIIEKR